MARGHVRKRPLKRPRPDGRRFVWDAWCPGPPGIDGTRRTVVRKGFALEREARAWISDQLAQRHKSATSDAGQLGQLLEVWLASKRGLKPTARGSYRRHIDLHLLPLAEREAAELTAAELLHFYGELLGKGLSPTTVRSVHATIRACLNWAVRNDRLNRNVAASIVSEDLPPKKHTEMTAWTGSEVRGILDAAGDEYRPLFSLIVRTGLRRGEALALRWDDLDAAANTLRIERSLVPKPGGGLDVLSPKTANSRRTVDVPLTVLNELTAVRAAQEFNHHVSGLPIGPFGKLIFTRSDGATPLPPGVVSHGFREAVRRAGVRPGRLHDLRHTFATLALTAGVPVIIVSRALGHAQPSTTLNVYGHLLPGTLRQATDAVAAALDV